MMWWLLPVVRAAKRSSPSPSRDTRTDAARQACSERCRTEGAQAARTAGEESAACDRGVMTGVDVLAFGESSSIADLHRAVLDVDVSELTAIRVSLARLFAVIFSPIGSSNRSDGVGCVNFKRRRTAAHRADDYRAQPAAEQSDLARCTDSVHQHALIYREGCRCAQL